MVPQKHKEASKFIYKSGFFITTNEYPDFGPGVDGDAIRKRLCVFNTTALPKKDNNVSSKYIFFLSPYNYNGWIDALLF